MTTATASHVPLAESGEVRPDLRAWHESSWGRPAVSLVVTLGLWLGALAIGLWSDHVQVRIAMVVPLTLAAGRLFTLGHDAGHGSLSTSPLVNAVAGRLALVPSVHVFGLWRAHHDVHHRYTNLRRRDFVWTPLTAGEYLGLPRWRRALHRFYRQRSGLGLGLQYTIQIWAPRMLWPRERHDLPNRGRLTADLIVMYGLLAVLALSAWGLVSTVDPDRAGDAMFWATTAVLLFVLPLLGTHWLIGFVVYLNHTHPDIVWYDDPTAWDRHRVQVEGSAGLRFPRERQALLPRRIMSHTAHHVDPGVPLRELENAQRDLVGTFGTQIVSYDWSPRTFREVLSHCKLYDYDAQRWLTYPVVEEEEA